MRLNNLTLAVVRSYRMRSILSKANVSLFSGQNVFPEASQGGERFFSVSRSMTMTKTMTMRSLLDQDLLRPARACSLLQKRFKKKGPKKEEKESDDENDSDDEKEADDILGKGFKDFTVNVNSLRMDVVLKAGTGLARSKIEEAFYENRVRLNGGRVGKKSSLVVEGDEIDLIKGRNEDNTDNLEVMRVVLLSIPDITTSMGRINAKVRKFKSLTVENYSEPYEGLLIASKEKFEKE